MPSGIRLQRIADRIRQELSEVLIREINDPRLQQIYVTDVRVDRELAFADVYVSAVEGVSRSADVLAGLESASGFLRKTLASRVELVARSAARVRRRVQECGDRQAHGAHEPLLRAHRPAARAR